MRLHFFIPAFFDVYERYVKSGQACKTVVQSYNKGKKRADLPLTLEAALCRRFAYYQESGVDLPVAALTAHFDMPEAVSDASWICRADPVHMRADRDQLVLFAGQQMLIDADECAQLEDAFNTFFADTGLTLHAVAVNRWYLTGDRAWFFNAFPLSAVEGQGITDKLPYGEDAAELRRLSNEIQMFFFNHPVNQNRHESTVRLPINGLWLWGAGTLASASVAANYEPGEWTAVYSDDVLARGLARITGVADSDFPQSFEAFMDIALPSSETCLLTLHEFFDLRQYEQWSPLMDKLAVFEMRWLHEMIAAVKKGDIESCEIFDEQGHCWRISGEDLAPFSAWRKKWLGR